MGKMSKAPRHATKLWATAAVLAATALIVRQQARRAERNSPPLGQFLEVEGVRLHYVERGQGQPLVVFHGNGSLIQDFAVSGLIDRAAERYRVIIFDRPGYGYSERPRHTLWTPEAQAALLHRALHRLGVERPIVVGHSWGTLVALALALDYPTDVQSLVLLSGYYFPTARLDVGLFSPPALPIVGDVLRYTLSPVLSAVLWPGIRRQMFTPAPVPPHFKETFPVGMLLRPSQLRASAQESALMIPSAHRLSHRYGELTLPVVILAGAGDQIADVGRQSLHLHQALPQSELRLVPGVGHMVHQSAPDQVMAAIGAAAQTLSQSALRRVPEVGHGVDPNVPDSGLAALNAVP